MQRGQSNALEAVEHALDLVPTPLLQSDSGAGWGQDLERRWAGRDTFAGEVESVIELFNRFLRNGAIESAGKMECIFVRMINEIKKRSGFSVCCCANDAYWFVQFDVEALKSRLDE